MFADDLILFAKAKKNNYRVVMDILNAFICSQHSSQKINFQKSKLYISPNVGQREGVVFSRICGMVCTKYLGVPLIHGRFWNNHFDFIFNKMHRKLSGWKTSVLSLAVRTTLVQWAVSSTIPNYTMQTIKIQINVYENW